MSAQNATSAASRFTNDSMASERRPTEPVSRHATSLSVIVTRAVATERRA